MHVVAPGEVGGLESVVRLLVEGHSATGHRVHVLVHATPGRVPAQTMSALQDGGAIVDVFELWGRAYLEANRRVAARLAAIHPDVVHTHGHRCDVLDGRVARRAGYATVSTVHGFTGGDFRNRMYERLQRRSLRRFASVVAVSRPIERMLLDDGVARHRVHLIPNAHRAPSAPLSRDEARRALGLPAEKFIVGWVGRVSAEKGADVAIEALALLDEGSLAVIGDGPQRAMLQQRSSGLALGDRVTWHGLVPGADRYLPAFDALLLSSRTEGTPMILLEAMAASVPVVTTRVGGVPDVIGDDEAWLVPSESPERIAAALRAIRLDQVAAAARAARASARFARERALGPWLAGYERVYRAALESRTRRA